MFKKISIIGVGLIGGSIGLACHKKKLAKEIVGVGHRASSISKAKKLKAIDKGTLDIKEGIKGSDLIIVATPIDIVIKKIAQCVKFAEENAIIIDVSSIKCGIVKKADNITRNKKGISFVGTHPMAGSEESKVSAAKSDLFKNSICIVTPSKQTKSSSFNKVKRFWKKLGAQVKVMSTARHDSVVANISHLPHLLAYSVCASVELEDMRFAGGGFRDLTRIAKSDPEMWAEIFIYNKANIAKAKKAFDKSIKLLESEITKKSKTRLLKKLNSAKQRRDNIA